MLHTFFSYSFIFAKNYNPSISTGIIELPFNVRIKCDYKINLQVSHPTNIGINSDQEWVVDFTGGTIELSFYNPVDGKWYTQSVSTKLSQSSSIPIVTGVSAYVKTTMVADINVNGEAFINKNILTWSSNGPQSFILTTSGNAAPGHSIEVNITPKTIIYLDLDIDFLLLRASIDNIELGNFIFPSIIETTTISSMPDFFREYLWYIIGGVVISGIIGVYFYMKRRQSQPVKIRQIVPSHRQPPINTPEHIGVRTYQNVCSTCGTLNRVNAGFCRKCGNSLGIKGKKICRRCRAQNRNSARFCLKCGETL